MIPDRLHALSTLAVGMVIASLNSCSPTFVDWSADPKGHFGKVYHQCFALNQDVFVIHHVNIFGQHADEYPYDLAPPAGNESVSDMPKTIEEYWSKPKEYWKASGGERSSIETVMPRGTRLRMDHLINQQESGTWIPFATVLDGPYRGKLMAVIDLMVDPDWPERTNNDWAVKPTFLTHCDATK